jgi:MFS family permease
MTDPVPECNNIVKASEAINMLLVGSILFITMLSNSAYAIIAPFLPFVLDKKGIDQKWMGCIFASYSIGVIVFSLIVGKMLSKSGRRSRFIAVGLACMGVSFLNFGAIT